MWMNNNIMDSASPIMNELILIHDYMMIICLFILLTMIFLNFLILTNKFFMNFYNMKFMEIFWSIIPLNFLLLISLPSILIINMMDLNFSSPLTLKILGNQWYWSYENQFFNHLNMNSYMIPLNNISKSQISYLEVSNKLNLPYNLPIRLISSSTDVIHSWTIQNLGIKLDAIPGHLNQANLIILRPGIFYGQCSELCGINHSFMPIMINSININKLNL